MYMADDYCLSRACNQDYKYINLDPVHAMRITNVYLGPLLCTRGVVETQ